MKHLFTFFIIIPFSFLFFNNPCYSQNEAGIWYFGEYAGIEFTALSPVPLLNSAMHQNEGCASIADQDGVLQFYTDGITVWNRNHQVMQNGTGLMGHYSATQSGVIVPHPGNSDLYYLFTVPEDYSAVGLRYSVIDMTLDNGLGAVTNTKNIYLIGPTEEKVTAVKHANNQDIWVLTHTWNSDDFYSYMITSSGLNTTPVVSSTGSFHQGVVGLTHGYMKVSSNGEKVAIVTRADSTIELFDFNNVTGTISNPIHFNHNYINAYGLEFSPDCSKLYLTEYKYEARLYQFDLNAGTPGQIVNSEYLVCVASNTFIGALQIAVDGKIYFTTHDHPIGNEYLSIINAPNELGAACDVSLNGLYLGGKKCLAGLPTFIQSYLLQVSFTYDNNCFKDSTYFTISDTAYIDSVFWKFNDPINAPFDTSTLFNPIYVFSQQGVYNVELTAYRNEQQTSVIKEVVIYPLPEPFLGNDTLFCNSPISLMLNANCDGDLYAWSTGQFGVPGITVSDTGLYWVTVSMDGCTGSDSIYIGLYPPPIIDTSNLIIEPASCGIADGSISGIQINGTEPLEYFWLDWSGDTVGYSIDIQNLSAGVYSLYVSDGNACTNLIENFMVTDDGLMEIDSVVYIDDHCSQQMAFIKVYAQEIGTGTISYSIDGGLSYWQNNGVFSGLSADTFYIMIKDTNNCEGIFEYNPVIIKNIPGPSITSISTVPEQNYNQDGEINLIGFTTEGSIYYSIDNGSNFQQDNGLFTGLSAGIYLCMIKDEFGCDTIFEVIVPRTFLTPLEAMAGDGNTCIGNAVVSPINVRYFNEVHHFQVKLSYDYDLVQCDGYINLHPQLENGFTANFIPAIGEIYLEWQGESPLTLPEISIMNELVFSALIEGNSAVNWETDHGECIFWDQLNQQIYVEYYTGNLRVYTNPGIQEISDQEVCENDSIIIFPSVLGGNGDMTYTWSGPGGFQANGSILYLNNLQTNQNGQYTLRVNDTLDCEDQCSFQLVINSIPEIAFAGQDTLYVDPGYELHAGSGYREYLWNTGAQTESIIIDSIGEYSVLVTSNNGCIATETVHIQWSGIPFYMPNAFTPDGDGLNDILAPVTKYEYIRNYHMSIFNRWGELVFETNNIYQGWDGTYRGKPAIGGVYVYRIDYSSQPDKTETVTDNVLLVE